MKKETILWKEDSPVNVLAADVREWPIHFHEDLELIYLLKGKLTIKSGGYTHLLSGGDVFIVNSNEIHSIESQSEENMVMFFYLKEKYFAENHPELRQHFFVLNTKEKKEKHAAYLRDHMGRIMLEILEKGYQYREKAEEEAHNIIGCLLAHFACSYQNAEGDESDGSKILTRRLARIMNYICENYSRKLTLQEIAEREGLSIYYLSHVMKECTSLSFQDFLNYIRSYESIPLLLETNKKVAAISEEMGFSAVRYYIKHFKNWYGMTPKEYRETHTAFEIKLESCGVYTRLRPEEIKEALKLYSEEMCREVLFGKDNLPVIIDIDLSASESVIEAAKTEHGRNGTAASTYEKAGVAWDKPFAFPSRLLAAEIMKPLARPYNLMRSLHEPLLKNGTNYMITATASAGKTESISILLYNLNEEICADLQRAAYDRMEILRYIEKVDINTNFLVKLTGLSGEYEISRYKMNRENAIIAYEDAINKQNFIGRRQMILNNWHTLPQIDSERVSACSALNLVSRLSGFAAELILIDRVKE